MIRMMTAEQAEAIEGARAIARRIVSDGLHDDACVAIHAARCTFEGTGGSLDCAAMRRLLSAATVIESRGAHGDGEDAVLELVDALISMVRVKCQGCGQIFADREAILEHIAEVLNVEITVAEDMLDDEHERLAFLERWAGGWRANVETLGLDGLGPEPRASVLEQVGKQIERCMAQARSEIRDAIQDGLGLDPQRADELIAAAEALTRKPDPELEALRRHAELVEQLASARHGREAPPLLRVDVHGPGDLEGIVWLAAPPRVGDIIELDALGIEGRPACRVTGAVRWLGSARVNVVVTTLDEWAEDWP